MRFSPTIICLTDQRLIEGVPRFVSKPNAISEYVIVLVFTRSVQILAFYCCKHLYSKHCFKSIERRAFWSLISTEKYTICCGLKKSRSGFCFSASFQDRKEHLPGKHLLGETVTILPKTIKFVHVFKNCYPGCTFCLHCFWTSTSPWETISASHKPLHLCTHSVQIPSRWQLH